MCRPVLTGNVTRFCILFAFIFFIFLQINAQKKSAASSTASNEVFRKKLFSALKWRCIGPYRSGRTLAVAGVVGNPMIYYDGQTGGGVWKTTDGGNTWLCVSDSNFKSSSVGAIAVSKSNPNIVYAGMGEVEMRNNISFGDGVYKTADAGKTWKHIGLENTDAIGTIAVDPQNPDIVYVAAMGKVF